MDFKFLATRIWLAQGRHQSHDVIYVDSTCGYELAVDNDAGILYKN